MPTVKHCTSGDIGGTRSGKCSQVNTADMSEADYEEASSERAGILDQEHLPSDATRASKANGEGRGQNLSSVQATTMKPSGVIRPHRDTLSDGMPASRIKGLSRHPPSIDVFMPWSKGAVEYAIDLFDVLEAWVFEDLRDGLHSEFMLSGHFQEYTRFLNIQHRPVTENDFILFRVLGRGGFGAVNGESGCTTLHMRVQMC